MALVNQAKKEINVKIVYYGPGLAGKTTNLNYVYRKLKPEFRGKLKTMNIQTDRMLFFDFTPTGQGMVNGYDVRFHVYTVMGDVSHLSTWKMVLKGVDGLVFVADSGRDRMAENLESFHNLRTCLAGQGKALEDIPAVIQCNKQNLGNALSPGEMAAALNSGPLSVVPAVAEKGEGVLDTLFGVVKMVLKTLRESGLELAAEVEAAAAPAAAVTRETETPSLPVTGPEKAGIEIEEPVIEFSGPPALLDGGSLRLPLVVRWGGREKRMAIQLSLSADQD